MKIGHYSPWLLSPGGVQSYLRRVVRGQRERGHEVVLFNRPSVVPSTAAAAFGARVFSTLDDADLFHQVRALKLDVLHVHTAVKSVDGSHAKMACVRTMHGHEAYCPSGMRYLPQPASRPCPRGCHIVGCTWGHLVNRCGSIRPKAFLGNFQRVQYERQAAKQFFIIAISHFAKEQMVRAAYNPANIRVVLNPVPAPEAHAALIPPDLAPPTPHFLFLGRLVPSKGLQWLLKAAAQVKESFYLHVAGSGPQEAELRRLAEQLGLADRVKWLGWLEESQTLSCMVQSHAVVFPSLWHEPAGLITLEAASMGRAVIASRVGGIEEYAAQLGNVLLVEPNDVTGLAAALTHLLKNPELAKRLGRTGRQCIIDGKLSLQSHLDALDETYYQQIERTSVAA